MKSWKKICSWKLGEIYLSDRVDTTTDEIDTYIGTQFGSKSNNNDSGENNIEKKKCGRNRYQYCCRSSVLQIGIGY